MPLTDSKGSDQTARMRAFFKKKNPQLYHGDRIDIGVSNTLVELVLSDLRSNMLRLDVSSFSLKIKPISNR